MHKQNIRVIVACEHPEVRYFLGQVVEEEDGVVIVGQADNAIKALTLTKNLKPDVAIIDSCLPHATGLDTVPLSRIGGLDTAQTISQETPNTQVIIVNNLDVKSLAEHGLGSDVVAYLSSERREADAIFTLQELVRETEPLKPPVFASVNVQRRTVLRQKVADLSEKAVLFGGLGIMGGLCLMFTVILAGAGVFLAAAGAATLFFGLAVKMATTLWTKSPQPGLRLRKPTTIITKAEVKQNGS